MNRLALALVAPMILAPGCKEPEEPAGWLEACREDEDCAGGLYCNAGWADASTVGICMQRCVDGVPARSCKATTMTTASCLPDGDGGWCTFNCTSDSDCPQDQIMMECRDFEGGGLGFCLSVEVD